MTMADPYDQDDLAQLPGGAQDGDVPIEGEPQGVEPPRRTASAQFAVEAEVGSQAALREAMDPANQSLADALRLSFQVLQGVIVVLIALFMLGGESVAPFSIALIVGVIVGTYSSIYTASATALYLNVNAQDLLPPAEDLEQIDDLP